MEERAMEDTQLEQHIDSVEFVAEQVVTPTLLLDKKVESASLPPIDEYFIRDMFEVPDLPATSELYSVLKINGDFSKLGTAMYYHAPHNYQLQLALRSLLDAYACCTRAILSELPVHLKKGYE